MSSAVAAPSPAAPRPSSARSGNKQYQFSEDWFTNRTGEWKQHVGPLAGKRLDYLEVGVFEGRSVLWMLEEVLTHAESRVTAVDVFPGQLEERFRANLEASGFAHKATTLKGYSHAVLRQLPLGSFDIIYIDGSHTADDVLSDAVLSLPLLRDDGLLIFDDYAWSGYPGVHDPPTPDELRPQVAIDAFITANRNVLEILHRGFQLFLRKRPHGCAYKEGCSPIGKYRYLWWTQRLEPVVGGEPLPLSAGEITALEALLRSRAPGDVRFDPEGKLREQPETKRLLERLGVAL